jgi:hypothetical protein
MKFINGLSEYSQSAIKSLVSCQKMHIKTDKNKTIEVARKIAKVKQPRKFEESQ